MAFDEHLADRVRNVLYDAVPTFDEKRMFGGLAFMVRGHMACGIVRDELMLRVGPDQYETVLTMEHTRPMDFTKRPMRGMVYVSTEGLKDDRQLEKWVGLALNFVNGLPPK